MAAGGAALAGAVTGSRDRAGSAARDGFALARREFEALNARLDKVDESHKRLFRALILVVSLSTGMDLVNLLKGDLLS
jgi:hypothetical protein